MSDNDRIEKQFVSPPSTYRPVPWWCWTGKMEKEEMERQLDEFLDKGIYEFFIFPIYGFETPTLCQWLVSNHPPLAAIHRISPSMGCRPYENLLARRARTGP